MGKNASGTDDPTPEWVSPPAGTVAPAGAGTLANATPALADTLVASVAHEGVAAATDIDLVGEPERFRPEAEIGRGGMGRVLAARDLRFDRPVAVKELLLPLGPLRDRFEREARITARLQHPSVVPVYAVGAHEGRPFYVMKRVAGRTLAELLAAATTLEARLALLPSVLAVAEAVAYAHRERIIHRDLKPQNVLVGDFGETVVIDWGLAKELGRSAEAASAADGPPPASLPPGGGDDLTQVGATLGTPAYMPPEQARGLAVDERADVYALGAILYELLAGEPPSRGSPALILAAVAEGPPTPIAARARQAPPDLVAIVDKALAREPAARYPTARELADDLRKFQTGQLVAAHRYSAWELARRWVRRHRSAVAVGLVAVVALVTVGAVALRQVVAARDEALRQRAIAEQRKQAADERFAAAEKLIEYLVGELKVRLAKVGRLDVLAGLGDRLLAYYADVDASGEAAGEQPSAVRSRTAAMDLVGEVERARGDLEAARRAYTASLLVRARHLGSTPGDPAWLRLVAKSYLALGSNLRLQARLDEAEGAFLRARALLEQAGARAPDDPEVVADAAGVQLELSALTIQRGDLEASLAEAQRALRPLEARLAEAPDDPRWRQATADAHRRLATAHLLRGDQAATRAAAAREIALLEANVRAAPEDVDALDALATAYRYVGMAEFTFSDGLERAAEALERSVALRTKVLAADPDHVARRFELAEAEYTLAGVELERGRVAEAEALLASALPRLEELAARDARNRKWAHALGQAQLSLGDVHTVRGRPEQALRSFLAAVATYEPDAAAAGEVGFMSHFPLADALLLAAEVAAELRPAEARPLIARALRLFADLEAKGMVPATERSRVERARALGRRLGVSAAPAAERR